MKAEATLRIYLRRSTDDGQQHFSLHVQREGCRRFVEGDLRSRWSLDLEWDSRIEYVDDGISGDDFAGRAALTRLLTDARRGDAIVARDLSRLGRDALETANVIRSLVRDRGVRIFFYDSREEVRAQEVMDVVMTVIKGAAAETELHAIRSRTREALIRRVENGCVAGGRTFGYDNVRRKNADGSEYTHAVINENQAAIVRRIFREFAEGRGLKAIVIGLNDDRIPSPAAGRRGSGSWSQACVHAMLRNERYQGVYVHGRVKRVKRGGKKIVVARAKSDPSMTLTRKVIPEWRIIDEATWDAVHARIDKRKRSMDMERRDWAPTARYALSGIAKCGVCGGAIGVARTKRGSVRIPAYACQFHHERGSAVCPVTIHQPVDEVDRGLAEYLTKVLLTPERVGRLLADVRAELDQQLTRAPGRAERLEDELRDLEKQRANLVRLAAHSGDDIPELAARLADLREKTKESSAALRVARHTEGRPDDILASYEAAVRDDLGRLHEVLAQEEPTALREALKAAFPDGLVFTPAAPENAKTRRVWAVSGRLRLGGSRLVSDPTGT